MTEIYKPDGRQKLTTINLRAGNVRRSMAAMMECRIARLSRFKKRLQ